MGEKSIRFGVADNSGKRSATWKCWTPTGVGKHDVYLTCRALGGALKASLHESGSWHIAFSQKFLDDNLDEGQIQSRFITQWPRPPELISGVTLAFRIIVPHSAVTIPLNSAIQKNINWISAPPEGKAVGLALFITSHDAIVTDWPGRHSMGTELVGKLELESRETIWVVHHQVDTPAFGSLTGRMTRFKGTDDASLDDPNLRAIMIGNAPDGSGCMVEGIISSSTGAA